MSLKGFFDLVRRRPDSETLVEDPDELLYGLEPLRILISPFANDTPDGRAMRHLFDRLSGRLGVTVSVAERSLTVPSADYAQPIFLSMAVELGQSWLKRNRADLIIWGDCVTTPPAQRNAPPGSSWRLRFIGPATPLQPHSGTVTALHRLEVPALFSEAMGDLVFATALAAVNVESSDGLRARNILFGPLLRAVTHFAEGDSTGTVGECATVQASYAALLLLSGAHKGDVKTLEKAVAVYQGALILGEDAFPAHERAMIGVHIADALALIGDLTGRTKLADKTVSYYRAALGMVKKENFPDVSAALRTRLGLALHGQAESTGEVRYLQEASEAFAAATSIWTITDAPERWADVQNSLGGLLITMGKLTHQTNLFDKAAAVFLKIAEARTRTKAPLVWATTLANMGAALKEKGMASKSVECLKQAAAAFDHAAQVFTELNLEANVRIVESERADVQRLLGTSRAWRPSPQGN